MQMQTEFENSKLGQFEKNKTVESAQYMYL